jgi:hypothetical protein
MLAPELHARERDVAALRERVRAELDSARQLAASSAADREHAEALQAEVQRREQCVAARECDARDMLARANAESQRRLKVGQAAFAALGAWVQTWDNQD